MSLELAANESLSDCDAVRVWDNAVAVSTAVGDAVTLSTDLDFDVVNVGVSDGDRSALMLPRVVLPDNETDEELLRAAVGVFVSESANDGVSPGG